MTAALAESTTRPAPPRRRKRSRRFCSFPSCDRPHRANDLCNGHNEQQRRGKDLAPLVALPTYAWTYVVYWPDALGPGLGVLKVGRSWSRWRVQRMLETGAILISNTGNTDESWERWALRFLSLEYERAFATPDDATELLWRGRGFTECFVVPEDQVYEAMDLCIYGYSYGNERGHNDPADHRPIDERPDATIEGEGEQNAPTPATDTEDAGAPPVCEVSGDARLTARALWLMADDFGRRRIDLDELAAKILPDEDRQAAKDTIELHILELEDAGLLSTYPADDGEWLTLHQPLAGPSTHSQRAAEAAWAAYSSTALGGERERARERARESVRAERAGAEQAWAGMRGRWADPVPRPSRPASLEAPPLGCSDHPKGALFSCGPCGTARRQYDAFMDARRYEDKLADFEFWHGAEAPTDVPF